MASWPPTVAATVLAPGGGAADPFGHPADEWPEVWSGRVVPAPVLGDDIEGSNRPDGTEADMTLHFPESCDVSLRGCRVVLGSPYSGVFEVVGNPQPYAKALMGWHMPASVRKVEG